MTSPVLNSAIPGSCGGHTGVREVTQRSGCHTEVQGGHKRSGVVRRQAGHRRPGRSSLSGCHCSLRGQERVTQRLGHTEVTEVTERSTKSHTKVREVTKRSGRSQRGQGGHKEVRGGHTGKGEVIRSCMIN